MSEKNNLEVYVKPGETGFGIIATFKDADENLINLDPYTVTLLISTPRKPGPRNILVEQAMTPFANQTTTGKGKAIYQLTEEEAESLVEGSYDMEGVLSAEGFVEKFPKRPPYFFGKLIVSDTIQLPG